MFYAHTDIIFLTDNKVVTTCLLISFSTVCGFNIKVEHNLGINKRLVAKNLLMLLKRMNIRMLQYLFMP